MTLVPPRLNHRGARAAIFALLGGTIVALAPASAEAETQQTAPTAEAETSQTALTAEAGAADAPHSSTARTAKWLQEHPWRVGVMAGYYFPTKETWGVDVNPLTFGFGLNAAWSMKNGVWFGVQGQYFLGSTVDQTVTPLAGYSIDIPAKTRLLSVGGSVGFDLPLGPVVFRNVLELGAGIVTWDFGDAPFYSLGYFAPMQGTKASFYMAPGIALLVPLGPLLLGPELRYRLDFTQRIPSSLGAQLHAGVRF